MAALKTNYIDEQGNYHNNLNLTLTQIYDSGVEFGSKIAKENYIKDLEKLKAEINEEDEKGIYFECKEWIEGRPCDEDYFYGLKRAIMIIDKHISELKGEQNNDTDRI